jgi:hypothetical protein
MGEVDLGEKKSAGIVVDKIACLRAMRRNRAALLFERFVIEANLESATD